MRLIDADAFKRQVAGMAISNNYPANKANALCELIDAQPTAYDPDKVVEQLEEACISLNDYPGYTVDIERATEIVKGEYATEQSCEWKLEDAESNLYATGCENRELIFEGTPEENGYKYCPYCGRKIKRGGVDGN